MPTYDAVIVSTSPIALLEALAREGAGERVLVVDDNTRIGGAWDYGTIGGHRRVEMGAHILRHHPGCYAFLRSHLGLPLAVEFGKFYDTVGFDINAGRVAELESGTDSTLETSEEELAAAVEDRRQEAEAAKSIGKYNTKDKDGKVRNRKKVGPKTVGPKIVGPKKVGTMAESFDRAFAAARRSGKKTFTWKGKLYGTKLAGE